MRHRLERTAEICLQISYIPVSYTHLIEAFVTENNPKYANRISRQLKAYAKANSFDKNYDPYKACLLYTSRQR